MIDVHVLTHEGTRPEDLRRCLASLEAEPCRVHVVGNAGRSVGWGRSVGFMAGQSELVSYLDSDDYVLPGTYGVVHSAMQQHRAVCTLEQVVTVGSGYVAPKPRKGHAVVCYRRSDILPYVPYMPNVPWCVDIFTRQTLQPVQLSWLGVVAAFRPGTARSRVTPKQMREELPLWPSVSL